MPLAGALLWPKHKRGGPGQLQRIRPPALADPHLRPRPGLRRAERRGDVLATAGDATCPGDVCGPWTQQPPDIGPLRPDAADKHGHDWAQPDRRRIHPRQRHVWLALLSPRAGSPDAEQFRGVCQHRYRQQLANPRSLHAPPGTRHAGMRRDHRDAIVCAVCNVRCPVKLVFADQSEIDRPEHAAGDEALPQRQIDAAVGGPVCPKRQCLPRWRGRPVDATRRSARPRTAAANHDRPDSLREHQRRV